MADKVKGITIEFRGDTTDLQKAIREIQNEGKALDKELREINRALKLNPGNADLIRQKYNLLQKQIEKNKEKLDTLKTAQKEMDAKGVDKNSEEYRKLQREIAKCEGETKKLKSEMSRLSTVKLNALGEKFTTVGKAMKKVGKTMSTYITAPLAAIGVKGAASFAEVDKTMQLTNKTMKNGETEAKLLDSAMKEAAANSTFGMTDAATATLNFARAGLSAEQAASTLAPAMNLAAGEGGNLDTVSAGLVATINGFHGAFEDAGKYTDVFANACNNSALDVDSLSTAMSVAAPVFSAAGYNVKDAALYLGVMANNGIDANKAANSLKTGLARLLSPTKAAGDAMAELGLISEDGTTAFTNYDGSLKSTEEIQSILHESFSKLSESEQVAAASAIFGKNQMAPWLALINTAPGDVEALSESLMDEGTTSEMASAMMSGFGGSLEKLKSSIDVLTTSIGQALAPIILKVASVIQGLVDKFNALSPQAQRIVAIIGLAVAALGPLIMILGSLASGIGSIMLLGAKIGPMLTSVGAAFAALSPTIIGVVAVIAGLIAIGILLYKNWDKIKEWATKTWEAISKKVTETVNAIKAKFAQLKVNLMATWNSIKIRVTAVWNGIKTAITNIVNSIKESISAKVTAIKEKITSAFQAAKDKVATIFEAMKAKITAPIIAAKNIIEGAIQKIKSIFSGLKLKLPKFKLPHFKIDGGSPPWGLGGKGRKPSFDVEWYANGGIFDSPSIVGIGEAGPEAVIPLDTLWNKLDRIADGAGASGMTINVYGAPGMSVDELAEAVERRMTRALKQNRRAWA